MVYFFQYYILGIFISFSIILSLILLIVCHLFSLSVANFEKTSSYECGFAPFGGVGTRCLFNWQFYVVSILFIIFDLEIAFIVPWSVLLGNLGIFGFWLMYFFLFILTAGFAYEWKKGALNWS